eukprot:scaffold2192_cov170-Amphora_coffeaeformis.AAC.28
MVRNGNTAHDPLTRKCLTKSKFPDSRNIVGVFVLFHRLSEPFHQRCLDLVAKNPLAMTNQGSSTPITFRSAHFLFASIIHRHFAPASSFIKFFAVVVSSHRTILREISYALVPKKASRKMKLTISMILGAAALGLVQATEESSPLSSSSPSSTSSTSTVTTPSSGTASGTRALQNYYNNYNNYNGQNYEEYVRYQMAQRSFSFTGCSTVTSDYGYNSVYATFRICDTCKTNRKMGCDNSNGDYIVSMQEFGETFSEYWEKVTYQDRNSSPFSCVKLQEYAEAQYYNQNQNYGNNGNGNGQQQQWYNGNNYNYNGNNNMELFVGPVCKGGTTIESGLFYDEDCAMPFKDSSLEQVLGFQPSNDANALKPPKCVPCMQNNYGGGGNNGELNPLCDRMLEDAGRCDRTRRQTNYDNFWQDMAQNGNRNNNMNYGYGNACSMIDSLPHMKQARRAHRAVLSAVWAVVAISVLCVAYLAKKGKLGLERLTPLVKKLRGMTSKTDKNADYHRETDVPTIT